MKYPNLADWRTVIALALAVIAAATGIVVTFDSEGTNNITITVQGPVGPTTVTAAPEVVESLKQVGQHTGARDETPPGFSDAAAKANVAAQETAAAKDDLPLTLPDAAPQQRGCRSRFARNKSSRNGVAPRGIGLHFTVSRNRPGWSDIDALTVMANSPSTGVSWHYNFDREGNCAYVVREAEKAWTAAAANPWLIQFEIVAFGDEPNYLPHRAMQKLARIIVDIDGRWRTIDATRRAVFKNCRPLRSGIIDHRALGLCAGGHVDITQHFPGSLDRVIRYVRAEVKARRRTSLTHRRCAELRRIRRSSTGHRWTDAKIKRAQALKAVLGEKRQATCR